HAVDTVIPSPFSHEILNANPYAYLDDAPLEERRARAVSLRQTLPESVLSEIGMLDPAAIADVLEQTAPDIRTADDLHDVLLSMIVIPSHFDACVHLKTLEVCSEQFAELVRTGRIGTLTPTLSLKKGEGVSSESPSPFLGRERVGVRVGLNFAAERMSCIRA